MKKKLEMLMILDGYGLNSKVDGNAIKQANTPNLDQLFDKYPSTTLECSGLYVGLPHGQMGNSEVGHLNIGAGRIIYQDLTKITKSIEDGDFEKNPSLNSAFDHTVKNNSTLHIHGLVSDGGVHSHIAHLKALLSLAKEKGVKKAYLHCFLDGRDVPPKSAMEYVEELEEHINVISFGQIATLAGRYYAMDRDKRWDRVEKAYDAMTINEGLHGVSAQEIIENSYARKENDEFLVPSILNQEGMVNDNDAIIMVNFRPDRAREITRAFTDSNFDGFMRKKVVNNLCYVCMTQYDATIKNVLVAYPPETHKNTLGEYISAQGLNQLRIAETEKYAHVTFFFNGGVEEPNKNEDRILIPSPNVATYDLQPEMSAFQVTEKVLAEISKDKYDLIILNFANADMVGHTGIIDAAIKALEALDTCVGQIVEAVLKKDGNLLLTADHGNADVMIDDDGRPFTAHSTNPVPLVNISNNPISLRNDGKLADIAPTILDLMNLEKPKEMTGKSLLAK